jgi:hypothetical protein
LLYELVVYSSATQIHTAINSRVPGDSKMADYIYLISYLASYEKDGFKANHNNFGNVWLTYNRGKIASYNQEKPLFFCAKMDNKEKIQTPFAIFSSFDLYVDYMRAALIGFIARFSNLEGSNEDNFIKFYIIDWLYGMIANNTALDANKNFERLNKNKFYAELNKKYADANISLKSLRPIVTEEQKELYVSARNKLTGPKLNKVCEYTYNNIRIYRTPAEPEYTLPYSLDMFFEAKNPKELLYLDAMNKTIEDTLVRLYILDSAPVVSFFDVKVNSGETYSIAVSLKIDKQSDKIPYTGFKFIAESGQTEAITYKITEKTIRDSIEDSPNFSKGNQKDEENDTIGDIISNENKLLNIKYWRTNYTKLILYPKLE